MSASDKVYGRLHRCRPADPINCGLISRSPPLARWRLLELQYYQTCFILKLLTFPTSALLFQNSTLCTTQHNFKFWSTCPETKFCNRVMIKMASSFYLRKPNTINIGTTINICRSTVPWHNNILLQTRNAE